MAQKAVDPEQTQSIFLDIAVNVANDRLQQRAARSTALKHTRAPLVIQEAGQRREFLREQRVTVIVTPGTTGLPQRASLTLIFKSLVVGKLKLQDVNNPACSQWDGFRTGPRPPSHAEYG